jgi:hypothetical protein
MAGGLMQLVAYGAQDIYLTGNPQITFFKVVYRRHTNFSVEAIEQTFNGTADFGKKVTCTISRNGDLIHRMYLQATLPAVNCPGTSECFRWVNYVGHALIKSVEIEIGGQRIDKHYGDWLNIWNELTVKPGHRTGYDNMVGNTAHLTGGGKAGTEATTLYIPLQFWFCRNPGLALPLIALQYHEVKINLEFRQKSQCFVSAGTDSISCGATIGSGTSQYCVGSLEFASLFVDYIYLDTDERRRFAQVSHEYLIEQLQFTGDESVTSSNVKIKLNFNHPCKEIIWVCQRDSVVDTNRNQWSNYTDDYDNDLGGAFGSGEALHTNIESGWSRQSFPDSWRIPTGGASSGLVTNFGSTDTGGDGADHAGLAPLNAGRNPTIRGKLQLNGHDRFQERLGSYFNLVQPYQHHTNVPATGINVYSFGLTPEEHQPSGTANFSRIDNATLQLQLTAKAVDKGGSKVRVYAISYNVLRIMSGMGGLAYSN